MFTGIIEEVGNVGKIQKVSDQAYQLTIIASKVMEDIRIGDSIAVNGVCLTVTHFTKDNFQVDAMPETIQSTSLQALKPGSKVNLERAMGANGRFGGHFVSGHVDSIGKITKKQRQENAVYYEIEVDEDLVALLMYKGSITVDGVSLTIFGVDKHLVTISIIPHTLSQTILGEKGVGDIVNIECDMLGKYVQHMLQQSDREITSSLTKNFLTENGFIAN